MTASPGAIHGQVGCGAAVLLIEGPEGAQHNCPVIRRMAASPIPTGRPEMPLAPYA